MAYSLIGSPGVVSLGGTNASVTPAWGTGESRTANNLLVCWVAGYGGTTLPGLPSGWSSARSNSNINVTSTLFYKIATGSDTAPTIAAGGAGITWYVQLAEFSGNATSSLVDQSNAHAGTITSPNVSTTPTADIVAGELIVSLTVVFYSSGTPTGTTTDTFNNATASATTNNATSTFNHYSFAYGVTTTNATADSDSVAFTTANASHIITTVVSFKLPPAVYNQSLSVTQTPGVTIAIPATHRTIESVSETTGLSFDKPTVFKGIALSQSNSETISRNVRKTLSPTQAQSVTYGRNLFKLFSIPQSQNSSISKQEGKAFVPVQGNSISLTNRTNKVLLISESSAVSLNKALNKRISITETESVTITKSFKKTNIVTQSPVATIGRSFLRNLFVSQSSSVITGKVFAKIKAITETEIVSFARTFYRSFGVSETGLVSVSKYSGKNTQITQSEDVSSLFYLVHSFPIAQGPSLSFSYFSSPAFLIVETPNLTFGPAPQVFVPIAEGILYEDITYQLFPISITGQEAFVYVAVDSDYTYLFEKGPFNVALDPATSPYISVNDIEWSVIPATYGTDITLIQS